MTEQFALIGAICVLLFVISLILKSVLRIVNEYERLVVFRFGRLTGAPRGPGFVVVIPIAERAVKVNLQEAAVPIPPQRVITSDNVTIEVDGVTYLQVSDPTRSVVTVTNWFQAAQLVSQTSLRSVIGHHKLDDLLTQRDQINLQLRVALDEQTEKWGVRVLGVEIRDVTLPEQIQRAMGREAEAERDRRAKIIAAEGELQASQRLTEAAEMMASSPGAMQLRTLQTITEIATENSSTVVFPVPMREMNNLGDLFGQHLGVDTHKPTIRTNPKDAEPAPEPEREPESAALNPPAQPSPPPAPTPSVPTPAPSGWPAPGPQRPGYGPPNSSYPSTGPEGR